MCAPQIRLSLFKFPPIALNQLHGLRTIDPFSWLGSPKVTHQTGVQAVDSIRGSGKGYTVLFSVLLLCFAFFVQNTLFNTKNVFPFAKVIYVVYLK